MTRVAPQGPTYWLLDGRVGWRGVESAGEGLVAGLAGIELGPRPKGELDLADPSGTLGCLRPPTGVQVAADGTVVVLATGGDVIRVLRGDRFVTLLGHDGPDDRTLEKARDITVIGDTVVCVDTGHRRVIEVGIAAGELRRIWSGLGGWRPSAVASSDQGALVLDGKAGRVWALPSLGRPRLVVQGPARRWTRIAVDREGRIYLYDKKRRVLDVFTATGQSQRSVSAAAEVRPRFDPPPISVRSGRFRLPPHTLDRCDVPNEAGTWWFDRDGRRVEAGDAPRLRRSYLSEGTWTSTFLGSAIPRCRWDRVEIDLDPLPPHTAITVWTAVRPDDSATPVPEEAWTTAGTLTAPDGRFVPSTESDSGIGRTTVDWPVPSDRGLQLAVRISVRSTGYATPVIRAVRVHYPRQPAVDLLPAVFGADPAARDFLERFLGGMLRTWEDLRTEAANRGAWFDPDAVPDGEPLRQLADRLGIFWEPAWSDDRIRAWLRANVGLLQRRGTPGAVRALVAAYLGSGSTAERGTGDPDEPSAYPQLVESFRERNRVLLDPTLGTTSSPLWGPGAVRRLQIGVYSTVGQARLVSTGSPRTDYFAAAAHRFRVYVPESGVPTADDDSDVRRVIATEAPAGTHADVYIVRPRLRVDGQSSVGLDTIIGDTPHGRLACAGPSTGGQPPLPPAARLGYDLVLGGDAPPPVQVAGAPPTEAGVRIGAGTVIR